MKKIKILLIMFFVNMFVIAQNTNKIHIYTANMIQQKNVDVYCSLSLQENNEYCFEISSSYEDMIISNIISYGEYIIRDKVILFSDKNNGYSFEYNMDGDYLYLNKKSSFFNLEKIKLKRETGTFKKVDLSKIQSNSMPKQNTANTLRYGIYISNREEIRLSLTKKGTYSYSVGGYTLSEGIFCRDANNNELILHDKNMNHCFYEFIDKKTIIDTVTCRSVELIHIDDNKDSFDLEPLY